MPPRLYYLDDIPTPYRLDVHRRVREIWPGQYRLAFCAAAEPGRSWTFEYEGLDVQILPGSQYRPRSQVNPISLKWNPSVWRSLAEFAPDVVAISGYFQPTAQMAAAWCRWHRVPYAIACETSLRSTATSGLRASLKSMAVGWMVRGMAFGLPVGREAAAYLASLGAASTPMFFFPNTPDVERIAADAERGRQTGEDRALRRELGISDDAQIVLFVGRMIDAKRPLDLLHAFRRIRARHPKSVLIFVGDGPLLPALKAETAADHSILCLGWISDPKKVGALMAIASVMGLPSQHEPWGAVVNEAMASATPVIATDRVGAATELIESGLNGYVYPVGDVDALAEALRACLGDERALVRMGLAAREAALTKGCDFAARNLVRGAISCLGSASAAVPAPSGGNQTAG